MAMGARKPQVSPAAPHAGPVAQGLDHSLFPTSSTNCSPRWAPTSEAKLSVETGRTLSRRSPAKRFGTKFRQSMKRSCSKWWSTRLPDSACGFVWSLHHVFRDRRLRVLSSWCRRVPSWKLRLVEPKKLMRSPAFCPPQRDPCNRQTVAAGLMIDTSRRQYPPTRGICLTAMTPRRNGGSVSCFSSCSATDLRPCQSP